MITFFALIGFVLLNTGTFYAIQNKIDKRDQRQAEQEFVNNLNNHKI